MFTLKEIGLKLVYKRLDIHMAIAYYIHMDGQLQGNPIGRSNFLKTKMECLECGKTFMRALAIGSEVRCPKCKGYDIDVAL